MRNYEKAAKLGHGLAMQSLGECFYNGIGCNANRRRCNHWLWRSCFNGSCGAIEMLDSSSHRILPGQTLALSRPNLASLLLIMNRIVKGDNFFDVTICRYLADCYSKQKNNRRTPLIGSGALKKVMKYLKSTTQSRKSDHFRLWSSRCCQRSHSTNA